MNNIAVSTNQHHVADFFRSRTALSQPFQVFRRYGRKRNVCLEFMTEDSLSFRRSSPVDTTVQR